MSIEDLNWWQVGRMDFICLFYFQKFSLSVQFQRVIRKIVFMFLCLRVLFLGEIFFEFLGKKNLFDIFLGFGKNLFVVVEMLKLLFDRYYDMIYVYSFLILQVKIVNEEGDGFIGLIFVQQLEEKRQVYVQFDYDYFKSSFCKYCQIYTYVNIYISVYV